jgi:hypothetical protein
VGKLAKVLIMLARLVFVVELGFGIAIASQKGLQYLKLHIGLGFAMAVMLLLLAVLAAIKKLVLPTLLGCTFAIVLPWTGIEQLPIRLAGGFRAIQAAHAVIAILSIGAAEIIYARVKRATAKSQMSYQASGLPSR